MTTEADATHVAAVREIYDLLDELDKHMNRQDASGRALLYRVKEHVRLLIISFDRSNME
jgi:hypothetical protein